jgi:pimeloyl-ACP methyl ester carboxylesterase
MKQHFDVGNRKLYAEQVGHGHPTVVIEVGSAQAGTQDLGWHPLRDALASETSVFLYDRAGMGASDPVPLPRPISEFVADLRSVLNAAGIEPPYILIGGSFGGMIVTHYAGLHPQEIAGIVLLDSPHPEINALTLAILPPETPEESESLNAFRDLHWRELYDPLSADMEGVDLLASVSQMRAAWDLGDIPLVVLTAGQNEWEEDFPREIAVQYEQLWLDLQKELAARSINGVHLIVEKSGHHIHEEAPDVVLNAIRGLSQART